MYDSLKPWIDLPCTVKPCIGRSGSGTKQFDEPFDIKCYAEGKMQNVKDMKGTEIVSNMTLYVDGDTNIKEKDNVIFEGRETEVLSIGYFYRAGKCDIKLVYV